MGKFIVYYSSLWKRELMGHMRPKYNFSEEILSPVHDRGNYKKAFQSFIIW